jgi:CRISPR-associated endonuclease/helicase Cas3
MSRALAHSKNSQGRGHELIEHLRAVAKGAKGFASEFGAGDLAYWAGLWHDLGKYNPEFQRYLEEACGKGGSVSGHGPTHSDKGALWASSIFQPLAFVLWGHHAGLPDRDDLKTKLSGKTKDETYRKIIELAKEDIGSLKPASTLAEPDFVKTKYDAECFIRMLFSCLVDADYLDTESHFKPQEAVSRGATQRLEELWTVFEAAQHRLSGKRQDPVNRVRHEVYLDCLKAAYAEQGFFRLTVPTGGGKTRSSMGFALQHALKHGLDRIIFAIPYTSIIEQTVDVYREILGTEALLEHHSAVEYGRETENPSKEEMRQRLAAENWDVPVIVTTTVQLFESLLAHRPGPCRKLHNIARSVLVLDEVQTLPPRLLAPILDVLRQLVAHYGATVVLCTATQPALEDSPYLKGLEKVKEIVRNPAKHFTDLKRVEYEWLKDGSPATWEEVAEEMRGEKQALAVVNTKRDALALFSALDDPEALHLSTLLCGAHRRDVLRQVRNRLDAGKPCRLVSTQVVEAGVDVDFPFVLRAEGPLDRIVQVAGRCNREGRLPSGRVVVFDAQEGTQPCGGGYRTGTETARMLVREKEFDFHDPKSYERYFHLLYQGVELDAERIQACREQLDFPETAKRFRMIEEDSVPCLVKYRGLGEKDDTVGRLIGRLLNPQLETARLLHRLLQPYLVNIPRWKLGEYEKDGLVSPLTLGLCEWVGGYDTKTGLGKGSRDAEELVI